MKRACVAAWALAAALLANRAHAAAALESLASQTAQAAQTAKLSGALVVTGPLTTDAPAPRAEELVDRLAQLVAGAIGGPTRAHPQTATLAQARVLASKGGRLVYLQPSIARGEVRVTMDAYPVPSNGWERVRDPSPPPTAHAFAHAPIDAEVRAFLSSIPLEHASVHRARHDEGDVLAAACGDLDGDGGMELVLASRTRVAVGRIVGGRFAPSKTVEWSALSPRAPVPLREPLVGASVVSDGDIARLLLGTTDRGGVALDASLARTGSLRGVPVPFARDACVIANPLTEAFEGDVTACASEGAPLVRFAAPAPRFDAFAAFDVVRPDGSIRNATAVREPTGKLDLRLADASLSLDGFGAQLALADLDQDGVLEVIGTAAEGEDALTVVSWDGASNPRPRLNLPAPAGVRALGTCPPEEGGAPAIVAVVEDEVWVVR